MIEQIVNAWNGSDIEFKIIITMGIVTLIGSVYLIYDITIKPNLKNKQKTTTQKYREGLIKK